MIIVTTHEGLEGVLAEELRTLGIEPTALAPEGRVGTVAIPADVDVAPLSTLRSAIHVRRDRGVWRGPPSLRAIVDLASRADVPELDRAASFAVRCEREEGVGDFQSPDVERAVGATLQGRYGVRVDLAAPEVLVAIDAQASATSLGVQHTRAPLSHRFYPRPYQQRTALKADVAFACLRVAERALGGPPTALLDPFCGSGTILLEAGASHPEVRLYGSDKKPDAALGAAANLEAFGLGSRAHVVTAELDLCARRLGGAQVDAIVTNPPYGVRMGARLDFHQLFARILRLASATLRPEGVVVTLAVHETELARAAAEQGYVHEVALRVRTGSVTPAIVRLRRGGRGTPST
ncbi:MAG: methyltransferase [Myxococcales bacterium]|nr:methyltransferase [Myxococcales bacterium]